MAGSNRRLALLVALPFLLLAMSGTGRAAGTVTDCSTFGPAAGTLQAALTGGGTVTFACSGTIIVPEIDITSGTTTVNATGQSVTLSGNNANRVFSVSGGATLNVRNLTVANGNSASSFAPGGGILNEGTLTVTNCTFSGNTATGGGGISSDLGTSLTVTNSTFAGNQAVEAGGGIDNGGTLTVTNSTFSGNTGGFAGGGGISNAGLGVLKVTNCTFFGNSGNSVSGDAGGIFNGGGATLKGTILAAESDGGNCTGTITDAGYNIADDGSCGFSGTSVNNSTTLNLDPAGLQNNGGPTQTIAIEPNSQALNFIPVASCKDQSSPTPFSLIEDQRGFPRPDSGNFSFCDAGAFELQTERITVVPGSEQTQIARPTTSSNSDQVNTTFTFIDHGTPPLRVGGPPIPLRCDAGNDALNGINVDLFEGTCADLATATGGLLLDLSPFVKHSISGHSYGTIFQSDPPDMLQQMTESVLARIVTQEPPWEETCGEWTIHIEVAGLDTATLGLGGSNPFALVVEDGDKNEGCFDVTNAVVGGQLPVPTHKVRRGARRGRR